MCTNSNTQANVNIEINVIHSIIGQQIGMIRGLGAEPEAIYLEKTCYDKVVADVLAASGFTPEDVTLKRYQGIPLNRVEDVRNMNHHTYFQGWGLPIQVTVKPNSFPLTEEQEATIKLEETKEAWLNSGRTIGQLPGKLKFEAMKEAEMQPDMLMKRMERYGSDFNIESVKLRDAFNYIDSKGGFDMWTRIEGGNFTTEEIRPADESYLTPVTENISPEALNESNVSDEEWADEKINKCNDEI